MDDVGAEALSMLYTSDITSLNLAIRVLYTQGKVPEAQWSAQELAANPLLRFTTPNPDIPPEIYVTVRLFSRNKPLSLPVHTSYQSSNNSYRWLEWLSVPTRYSELPRDVQVTITLWSTHGPRKAMPIGGTTFGLFDEHGVLLRGRVKLYVWPHVEADGASPTTTPGFHGVTGEMDRLEERIKLYDSGDIQHLPWLDPYTFKEIQRVNMREAQASKNLYLFVELPAFDYPVVCQPEEPYEPPPNSNVFVYDPDAELENPVEKKHRLLARAQRHGMWDRTLKPSTTDRKKLELIFNLPPMRELNPEEKDFVWKFRFALVREKKALAKFLKSVEWTDPDERANATQLMESWVGIDADDTLELLGREFQSNSIVREFAVSKLREADDETIKLYLLQLVQSLRYESRAPSSNLARLLVARGSANFEVGTFLHWYLVVECEDKRSGGIFRQILDQFLAVLKTKVDGDHGLDEIEALSMSDTAGALADAIDTVSISAEAVSRSLTGGPSLVTAGTDSRAGSVSDRDRGGGGGGGGTAEGGEGGGREGSTTSSYSSGNGGGNGTSSSGGGQIAGRQRHAASLGEQREIAMLRRQRELVGLLGATVGRLNDEFGKDRPKKVARLREMLTPQGELSELVRFAPLRLPLDPNVAATGVIGSECNMFKSAMSPLRIAFQSPTHPEYKIIFKRGDDLRQDQLIIQIITIMNRLLRRENLELQLTPYCVLATSDNDGMLQLVPAFNVSQVLAEYKNDIQQFLVTHRPDPEGPYGMKAEVLDNFVKSCAGYCVITYILGIGDRHLDNLMITTDGRLFHIDFGYILGRDPKPFPPPMKLCREMVDAMGGTGSQYYGQFVSHCCESFNILRKSANLVLNLISLMVDANIPDLAVEPEACLARVCENYRLDLNDEDAVVYFQGLIDASVRALFPQILESFHQWAQYFRK